MVVAMRHSVGSGGRAATTDPLLRQRLIGAATERRPGSGGSAREPEDARVLSSARRAERTSRLAAPSRPGSAVHTGETGALSQVSGEIVGCPHGRRPCRVRTCLAGSDVRKAWNEPGVLPATGA